MEKVIALVLKELRERRTQLSDALANGAAKDYAEYKFLCGEIRGLTAVEIYLQTLAKNLEHDDE
jgi:hypothetical protein